jgi:hypothetical protein
VDGHSPDRVRRFVQDTNILDARTPEQWQLDAFGQVDAWLRALGLRGTSAALESGTDAECSSRRVTSVCTSETFS